MRVQSLACALVFASAAAAQESSSVTEESIFTIQTSNPTGSETQSPPLTPLPSTTEGPLTNPLRPSETLPVLQWCSGVYTTSCATPEMSIPQGETPISTSGSASATEATSPAVSSGSSGSSGSGTTSDEQRPTTRGSPTSSVSGAGSSAPPSSTPAGGAASSLYGAEGRSLGWVVAVSGLSATLGFAWTLF